MNIPADKLTRWAAFAEEVRNACLTGETLIRRGQREDAAALLADLHDRACLIISDMERAGADLPAGLPARRSVPLEMLSTPTSRAYADAMRRAYELARAVDHERGYGDDGPADFVEGFAEAAALDAYGPQGKVRE